MRDVLQRLNRVDKLAHAHCTRQEVFLIFKHHVIAEILARRCTPRLTQRDFLPAMSNQNRQLYIVISQTGTLLSRILKQITGAEYNHASISLSRDLERMYSFGRRHPYNPFWGGFVIESPRTGTFKRFSETKVLVLSVSVTEEQHAELKEMLDVMWKRRRKYSYNYIGLCLAYFHVVWKQEGC